MTVTESPAEADAPAASETRPTSVPETVATDNTGLAGVVGSGDHRVVGRLFLGFSLVFLLVAEVATELVTLDRVDGETGTIILGSDTVFQVLTLGRVSAVFLFAIPAMLGLALCVVPGQIGAPTVAFPRAAASAAWAWVIGSLLVLGSYVANGGPGGGDPEAVSLWITGLFLVIAGLCLASVSVVTTVLALRTPGMTTDRTPFFSWSMVAAGSLWLLSLPVLAGTLILVWVDNRYGQLGFGASTEIWSRVSWVVRQPQIYALAVPLLGVVSEVLPVATRHRLAPRSAVFAAIGAFAVLGYGAFLQPSLYPAALDQPVYAAFAVLALLPVLALFGGWATTARTAGRITPSGPLVLSVVAALMLLIGVVMGAVSWIGALGLADTLFADAQANYVLLAVTIAVFAALWHWAPIVVGRTLAEGLGRTVAVVLLVGTVVFALPDAISGAFGTGAEASVGIEALNGVSAAGGALVILGSLAGLAGVARALRDPDRHPALVDPWGGHTLEWTTSPPDEVGSGEPLLDPVPADEEVPEPAAAGEVTAGSDGVDGADEGDAGERR